MPTTILAIARRRWAFGAILAACVILGSTLLYLGPQRAGATLYRSQTTLRLVAQPATPSAYDAYRSDQRAAALAARLASAAPNAALTSALAAQLRADAPTIAIRSGATTAQSLSASSPARLASALTTTANGPLLTITARWPTAAGAWALTDAATRALPALLLGGALPPSAPALTTTLVQPPTTPTPDPAIRAQAQRALLLRIILGLLAGVLFIFLADLLLTPRPRLPAPTTAPTTPT